MQTLLSQINSPTDVRKLRADQLEQLCLDLRNCIIDHCALNPGHFGASLGVVELAVALHYVYNTPYDKLVWDVGHQAYAHKILTGRRDNFSSNRKYKGLSGFPKIAESEYDAFGVGHASTSISAALGMAMSAKLNNENRQVVAIIGDGSMTGGLAFEGLNNAGWLKPNMLVILNDNDMAIDPNVGGLKDYLSDILLSHKYNRLKKGVWEFLGATKLRNGIRNLQTSIKSVLFQRSNFFEALGFRYFGPINGNDIKSLTKALRRVKDIQGPCLLHIVTQKGKGYKPAEENQTEWHAPGKFNKDTGTRIENKATEDKPIRYQEVFGETIVELAEINPKIVGVTPAMPTGCSLNIMMDRMPNRAYDVGIAEAHAVTFSAGLAASGHLPFCNIYSSFMQRAYDNVIHDVALQNLNVVLCLDRGGLVGEDGATHHGAYDLAYLRCVPNIIVSSPMNEVELRNLMYTAQLADMGAFVIRYPRGNGVIPNWRQPFEKVEIGKARTLKPDGKLAVLTIGPVGNDAAEAIQKLEEEGTPIAHFDMRFIKPIDEELLHQIGNRFTKVITVENGTIVGGLGTAVADFFATNNYATQVIKLGIPDRFIEHGTVIELQTECGFDANSIYNKISLLSKTQD